MPLYEVRCIRTVRQEVVETVLADSEDEAIDVVKATGTVQWPDGHYMTPREAESGAVTFNVRGPRASALKKRMGVA